MIKVAVFSERTSDQCCWYRSSGPFSDSLFRKNNIHFKLITQYNVEQWAEIADCDIIFFLRPYRKNERDMIILALSMNKKVWIDYDDDFTVPEQCVWSSQHIKTQTDFKDALWHATKITVSTPAIKNVYEKLTTKPIELIYNGFNFELLKNMKRKTRRVTKSVSWRGSETHEKDLQEIAQVYAQTIKRYPEFVTTFYGAYPKFLAYYIAHQYMRFPIPLFHNVLADQQHKILMHPLENTQWNTGKSNAAWLEGTMAGSTIISRDLPEWRVPNCYTYKDTKEFSQTLDHLLQMDDGTHLESVRLGQEFIGDSRNLSHLNEQRLKIIYELMETAN